uniref:Putative secreted protein n=1 Tax=Anopheles triannulatus TaxID=58253 RepID=A0A2M4B5R0_9DIPT
MTMARRARRRRKTAMRAIVCCCPSLLSSSCTAVCRKWNAARCSRNSARRRRPSCCARMWLPVASTCRRLIWWCSTTRPKSWPTTYTASGVQREPASPARRYCSSNRPRWSSSSISPRNRYGSMRRKSTAYSCASGNYSNVAKSRSPGTRRRQPWSCSIGSRCW